VIILELPGDPATYPSGLEGYQEPPPWWNGHSSLPGSLPAYDIA